MQSNFKCNFCNKKFVKESTMFVHVCEQKRRHLAKNEKHVRMGLQAFNRFFEITQRTTKPKTFAEFSVSPFYTAFVKFGSFVVNTSPIYPEQFIDYVVQSGVKLDHWCKDELYDKFIIDIIKKEPADGAIQRTLTTMIEWGEKNNQPWEHYFQQVTHSRLVYDIKEGKISPWVILNTKAGKNALQQLTDEQLAIIIPVIDPAYWKHHFKTHIADTELVNLVVTETKIL